MSNTGFINNLENLDILKNGLILGVQVNKNSLIKEIDENVELLTARNKAYYAEKHLTSLVEIPKLSIKKTINESPDFIKHLNNDSIIKLRISPDALKKKPENIQIQHKSNLYRIYCKFYKKSVKEGYQILLRVIPGFMDGWIRAGYQGYIIILNQDHEIIDCNENFFLAYHRIYTPDKIFGCHISRFIKDGLLEKFNRDQEKRLNRVARLIKNKAADWRLFYGGKYLDFSRNWKYDCSAVFQIAEKKINCSINDIHSYMILNKELPASSNDFKIDFTVLNRKTNIAGCFIFGHNQIEKFSPDANGYCLAIFNNEIIFRRKTKILIRIPFDCPQNNKTLKCSALFNRGVIQFFINGKKYLEYVDFFPIYPSEVYKYCGLVFGNEATFSNFVLFSLSTTDLPKDPVKDEFFIKLHPFPDEIYEPEISFGDYCGKKAIFLFLKNVTDEFLLKQAKESLEKETQNLASENIRLQQMNSGLNEIIGVSAPMLKVKSMVNQVSGTLSNILILGETGTGKDLAALQIHKL
ncbi:MAG: sigma 54-interacting transcriptional regulator, partial [bacterium]